MGAVLKATSVVLLTATAVIGASCSSDPAAPPGSPDAGRADAAGAGGGGAGGIGGGGGAAADDGGSGVLGGGLAIDPGVRVAKAIVASVGGTLTASDGTILTIPPGALPSDTTVSITTPTGQTMATQSMKYIIEPDGLVLKTPATLTIAHGSLTPPGGPFGPRVEVHVSSELNPILTGASEKSNWSDPDATVDAQGALTTVSLAHFSAWYILYKIHDTAYLVVDIPPKFMLPGDLFFTLTTVGTRGGPSWYPGHVAAYVGDPSAPDGRIAQQALVESTTADGLDIGVIAGKADTLISDPTHLYLGPRRSTETLSDADRTAVVSFLNAQVGKGYSLIGQGLITNGSFSCVGLCAAAYASIDKSSLSFFSRASIPTPYDLFAATAPISEFNADVGTPISLRMYGAVVDPASPSIARVFRGWYSKDNYTIDVPQMPAAATLTGPTPVPRGHEYLFQWTPGAADLGHDVAVRVHMKATPFPADDTVFPEEEYRTLTIHVCHAGPVPVVSGVSTASGKFGDSVTITGTGLGRLGTTVRFNGVLAGASKTDTQIVTTVPGGAITGPLTVTVPGQCGGEVTALPTFTVPAGTNATKYWVTETDTNVVTNSCLPCSVGSTNPFTAYATFGSDGSFFDVPGAGMASGAFNVNTLVLGCSTDTTPLIRETFQGAIAPDGALAPTVMSFVVPQGTVSYGPNCWGKSASKTVSWAPKFVDWQASLNVTYPKRCPMNDGATTDYLMAVRKTVATHAVTLTPVSSSSTWFTGTLASGGAYRATGANSYLVVGQPIVATFTANGGASGTIGFTYSDGCTETNPFTLTPLSPVLLGIP